MRVFGRLKRLRRRRPHLSFGERQERFGETSRLEGRMYWWLWGQNEQGRYVALGAYNSEAEAQQIGYEKYPGEYEVVPLRTRSSGEATRMLKARRLGNEDVSLDEAMQRVRHQV